jgi:hypothetical protein
MAVAKVSSTFTPELRKLFFEELSQQLKDTYNVKLVALSLSLSQDQDECDEKTMGPFGNYFIPLTTHKPLEPCYLAHIGYSYQLDQQRRVLEMFWNWKDDFMTKLFMELVLVRM